MERERERERERRERERERERDAIYIYRTGRCAREPAGTPPFLFTFLNFFLKKHIGLGAARESRRVGNTRPKETATRCWHPGDPCHVAPSLGYVDPCHVAPSLGYVGEMSSKATLILITLLLHLPVLRATPCAPRHGGGGGFVWNTVLNTHSPPVLLVWFNPAASGDPVS